MHGRITNPERWSETYGRYWRSDHPEVYAKNRRYRERHRDEIRARNKAARERDPELTRKPSGPNVSPRGAIKPRAKMDAFGERLST
jgi:hypothetical protein